MAGPDSSPKETERFDSFLLPLDVPVHPVALFDMRVVVLLVGP